MEPPTTLQSGMMSIWRSKVTLCDGPKAPLSPLVEKESIHHQKDLREKEEESCKTCLYTGVLTCTSLSLYFGYVAWDEYMIANPPPASSASPHTAITSTKVTNTSTSQLQTARVILQRMPRNSYLWGVVSVGWAMIGVYRYQMG